jgi:hypothetical protein
MPSPEQPPPPKPANLLPAQVPWGMPKPAPSPSPKPAAKSVSAKQVPWGSAKTKGKNRLPAPKAPSLSAKQVPWAVPKPPPTKAPEKSTWALPKTESLKHQEPPPEPTRESLKREAEVDREPTAAELVAMLSHRAVRTLVNARDEHVPLQAYKARPISFAATRWDVMKMQASAHRLRLSAAGVGLGLVLGALYLLKLVSLNAQIEHQWQGVEGMLRQRYALVPAYVECIAAYSDQERYALALTEKGLHDWRTARTDMEIAAAAEGIERVLTVLARTMNRYDQNGVAKDPAQVESSTQFARLQEQRAHSRALLSEAITNYNKAVENFNDKVLGVPGSWIAWAAHLHARAPLFAASRQ